VDGSKLGYLVHLRKGSSKHYAGIWSQNEHTSTTKAFRFEKPRIDIAEDGTTKYNPGSLMGNVQVLFYEAIFDGYKQSTRTIYSGEKKPLVPSSVVASSANQNKKVLRSGKGEHSESKAVSQSSGNAQVASYKKGAHVETITVNYCTALGLIHAGVLAKPDDPFVEVRMANPWKRPTDGSAAPLDGVVAKRKKREGLVDENGVMIEAPKELDLYDLAGGVGSDDEN
jgi:hypothetical protein